MMEMAMTATIPLWAAVLVIAAVLAGEFVLLALLDARDKRKGSLK
jgi:hypothetical protein